MNSSTGTTARSNNDLPLPPVLAEALRVNGWESPTWNVLSDREKDVFRQGVVHGLLAARGAE